MAGGEKWHDGVPDIVRRLAGRSKAGLTDDEVAEHLGVAVRTVHRWKKDHREFAKALIETKALLDSRVELSLYRRALGYSYKEVEVTLEGGEVTKRVERVKEVPPDISAIRLWLTNRDAESWRDKQDVRVTGDLTIILRAEDMGVPDE
jgi:transcriptional regulator with XRE-family HTH domain